ncbi:alpha/beta fold hydrolase [Oleomonas cavernae]|nr:alpha/beta hydrolase [Oleomonas cavernae]
MKISPTPAQAAHAFITPHLFKAKAPAASPVPDLHVAGPQGDLGVWTAGSGPAVLLVHGWEGNHLDLGAFVEPLVAAGRRVVSLDLPAHGVSAGTRGSIPDLAAGVRAVADAIGPVEAVIAHSIGSPVTVLALDDGLACQRVALISPPMRYTDFARATAHQVGVDPDGVVEALRDLGIDIDRLDVSTMAPRLRQQALLIHSAEDRVTSVETTRKIAANWAGSRMIEVKGLGHRRILRDPTVIETVVDFVVG